MKRLSVCLVFLAFGLWTGCSDSSSGTQTTLSTITVVPGTASIAKGQTQAFTATGNYSDGSSRDISSTVTWASSNAAVATLSGATATAAGTGSATISATMASVSGSASLTVTPAILVSIALTPDSPTMSPGMFQQFTATGTLSDGTTQDLTSSASWASATTSVAAITSAGYLTSRTLGTSSISATSGSVTGTTTLTVAPPTLTSITIPGGDISIANGTSHAFGALGVYSDGGQRPIAGQVTWASSDTSVATVSAVGQATGASPGSTTISATMGSISQTVKLTVTNATLTAIAVAPSTRTIEPLTREPFTAVGIFSDATTQVVTPYVTWGSSNTGVATISNVPQIGMATAVANGTTSISAVSGAVSGAVPLLVSSSSLTGITLTPGTDTMAIGSTSAFRALALYSDGNSVVVGTDVSWQSSDPTVATINAQGTITGLKAGTTTITATLGGQSATATMTVEPLTSIAITPATLTVAAGTYLRFTATGTLQDGTTQNLTSSVTWTSSSAAVGIISNVPGNFGGVIGLTPGTATIGAVLNGIVGSSQATITGATLTSITLTPATPTVALGGSQQFKAVGHFSDGSNETITPQVRWKSSDVTVAIVDSNGAATPSGSGTTTITATMDGVSASTVLTVP